MNSIKCKEIETYSFSIPIGWIVSQAHNPAQSGFASSQNMLPACFFTPHCTNKITAPFRAVILLNSAPSQSRKSTHQAPQGFVGESSLPESKPLSRVI
jgi:hypothetical protein